MWIKNLNDGFLEILFVQYAKRAVFGLQLCNIKKIKP